MGGDGKIPVGYEVARVLPLQIIIILAILFLLVLCCMVATQLAQAQVPEKAHTGAIDPFELHYQDSRQSEWSTQEASPISVVPLATTAEVGEGVAALQLGTPSGKVRVHGGVGHVKVIPERDPSKPKGAFCPDGE